MNIFFTYKNNNKYLKFTIIYKILKNEFFSGRINLDKPERKTEHVQGKTKEGRHKKAMPRMSIMNMDEKFLFAEIGKIIQFCILIFSSNK